MRDVQGNESLTEKLRDTKRLAFRLATQITNCPKRSTFPRREWTVPDDCISFDKRSKLNEEFGALAKVPKSFRSPGRETALGSSEQCEADRHPPTDSPADSPAEQAAPSPAKSATIQRGSNTGKRESSPRIVERNFWFFDRDHDEWYQKQIADPWNKDHPQQHWVQSHSAGLAPFALKRIRQSRQSTKTR